MDNQFPQMLYKAGGPEQIHGGNFSTLIVESAEQLEAALSDGWSERTDDAVELRAKGTPAKLAEKPAGDAENTDEDAPPTRAELEAKAAELGLKVHHNVGDKKLAELIAAKLAENAAA